MNREIKFRGKRVDNGEWVYGYYLYAQGNSKMLIDRTPSNPEHWVFENISFDSHLICTFIPPDTQGWDYNEQVLFHKVIPETVGQFTGLNDKNGKEIYEGDRVKCLVGHTNRRNDLYTIIYRLGCPSMDNGTTETPVSFATIQDQLWSYLDYDTKISLCLEITGNIHDND